MEQVPDDTSANIPSDAKPLFVCDVLDADEYAMGLPVDTGEKRRRSDQRYGLILYVSLVSGSLPSPVSHIEDTTARFEPRAFTPTPVRLIAATGHIYDMTLLGSFPPLSEMPPSMRAMFHPASNAGPEARPVILEGEPRPFDAFRPRNAQVLAVQRPEKPTRRTHSKRRERLQRAMNRNERIEQHQQFQRENMRRVQAVLNLIQEHGPDAAIEPLLAALNDELEDVRVAAAYQLKMVANRLPLAPFLTAIRERTSLNVAVCQVAADVFLAHADEVPINALLDLNHGGDAPGYTNVRVTSIQAMGRLGERVTDEILALLTNIVIDQPPGHGLLERHSAAKALADLGARAPVGALIAGLQSETLEVAPTLARALLRHPSPVPEEILAEARLLSDYKTAHRIHCARIRERLNQQSVNPRDKE